MAALAGCAAQPTRYASGGPGGRSFDARLGVYASPRLYADGEPIPRGGGQYLVGRPYTVGGRAYYPNPRPDGYTAVGTASWYGDAFHGRRTANGEIFDKNSISAAHPTLPLPSYVRVTNLGNDRSMIVRVNDRGPYHGGRVMDVSQRVAEVLDFKRAGTARIRVDYIGRAGLAGSDDAKLMASLRMDGGPAQLDGTSAAPTMVADQGDDSGGLPPAPAPSPMPRALAQAVRPLESDDLSNGAPAAALPAEPPYGRRRLRAPVPPQRPFEMGDAAGAGEPPLRTAPARQARATPAMPAHAPMPPLISFAATDAAPTIRPRYSAPGRRPPTLSDDSGN
ncbi:MAG TPA: septal ring lytic transglycosylase RlpA family protein [Lichenihabitans sp.]|nr:septal ring lytic transglycosylase RlpA family protein [Lichenihabitans sp.]